MMCYVAAASERCCRDLAQPIRPPPPLPPPRFPNNAVWQRETLDLCVSFSHVCVRCARSLSVNCSHRDMCYYECVRCRVGVSVRRAGRGLGPEGRQSVVRELDGGSPTRAPVNHSPRRHSRRPARRIDHRLPPALTSLTLLHSVAGFFTFMYTKCCCLHLLLAAWITHCTIF